MSISQKIKSALKLGNKKQIELAEYMGMTKQTLGNKFSRDSWTASDLIKVAELTGSKIAFTFPDESQVLFTIEEAHETNRQIKQEGL